MATWNPAMMHPKFKLGLRPADLARKTLKLHWSAGAVPPSPDATDNLSGWSFDMGGNDRFGTCGPTSVANHREMTTAVLTGTEDETALNEVYALYRQSGNPTFDPRTGRGDDGVVMSVMLGALAKFGLGDGRILGFAQLADQSESSVQAAISRFGGVLFAVSLQVAQQHQTDLGKWDYARSSPWGGHAILAAAYDRALGTVDVVTWAKRVSTTRTFRYYQLDEVWVPLWSELVTSGRLWYSGADLEQLARDYESLTGRPFPSVLPPAPPLPPPTLALLTIDPNNKRVTLPPGWTCDSNGHIPPPG